MARPAMTAIESHQGESSLIAAGFVSNDGQFAHWILGGSLAGSSTIAEYKIKM